MQQSGRARRRLDVVEFYVGQNAPGAGEVDTVTPYVNGISLIELARRAELRPATEQGEPGPAGSYAGLVIAERRDWKHWYLNDDPQTWFGDGDSSLLGCICGATSCWPLTARVSVADSQITWSEFRTGLRSWDLRRLGRFVVQREQYNAALATPR